MPNLQIPRIRVSLHHLLWIILILFGIIISVSWGRSGVDPFWGCYA